MKVLFIAPHFPAEMPQFTRGLAEVGATVVGAANVPYGAIPPEVRQHLSAYVQVPNLLDTEKGFRELLPQVAGLGLDRVETNWEPTVLLAAKLRDALGLPGLSYDAALGFRDKAIMKDRLQAAGIRVPINARIRAARQAWVEAERIGYPLVIKPIAGAGSQDTYLIADARELEDVLPRLVHVDEASIEEYVDGKEYTYDTVSIDGAPAFESVANYFPKPIESRSQEWISPAQIVYRTPYRPELEPGLQMGRAVLKALGMETGFTHMEWYLKSNGEAVFGEIGCRAPGGKLVDQMNFANNFDVYREWARAICHKSFEAEPSRAYHVATIFKRAMGRGAIQRIEGLGEVRAICGSSIVAADLLPVGHPRRDWRQTLLSDGYVTVRHPDFDTVFKMMSAVISRLRMYAG